MKIAFINPEYPSMSGRDHGGIATYIYNQANALASLGHTVHVLAKSGVVPDPLHPDVQFHQFNHTSIRYSVSALFQIHGNASVWERGWSKAAKLLLMQINGNSGIDIVEIPEYNGLAYEFGPGTPFPVVVHFHTPSSLVDSLNLARVTPLRRRWYGFEKAALRRASAFKCTSESLKTLLPRFCKPPRHADVTVIHNPMPPDFSENIPGKTEKCSGDRIDILFTGRLERRKGAEIILRAVQDILDIDARIHITFAGETDFGESETYRQGIERALDGAKRQRLWFLGAVERINLPALYRRSDIFIIPSLFDNAPNSMFEAMAAGLPVVAADAGGMNEIIHHEKNGLLFPAGEPSELTACIRHCITFPHKALEYARNARQDVMTIYNPERIAHQTTAFYEAVIQRSKPRRHTRVQSVLRSAFRFLPVKVQISLRGRVSLLYSDAGYGDTLLIGAVAREIKRVYGSVKVTVNGAKEELLRGNPWVNETGNRRDGIDLNYHYGPRRLTPESEYTLLDIMCSRAGIRNPEYTVDIFLDENELIWAKETVKTCSRPLITIQTTAGPFGALRKHWPQDYWEQLILRLTESGASVIHLGSEPDIPVKGAIDCIGRQDIRRSIAILREADVHIGVVSSLMHGAEAVRTPAVIIFGGFEKFGIHQYSHIHPLSSPRSCAPCIQPNTEIQACPYNLACMKDITPTMVFDEVMRIISSRGLRVQSFVSRRPMLEKELAQ